MPRLSLAHALSPAYAPTASLLCTAESPARRGWFVQVTFTLHPSFKNPVRVLESPPYEVTESGWGEFDVGISVRLSRALGRSYREPLVDHIESPRSIPSTALGRSHREPSVDPVESPRFALQCSRRGLRFERGTSFGGIWILVRSALLSHF